MIRKALSWLEGMFSDASDFAELENHIAELESRVVNLMRRAVERDRKIERLEEVVEAASKFDRLVTFTPDPKIAQAQSEFRTALSRVEEAKGKIPT